MKILHVSDLHYVRDEGHKRVLTALFKDVAKHAEAESFDLIVFSGDAYNKGGATPEKTRELIEDFIVPLKKSAGPGVEMVICPGNHDINLKSRPKLFSPIFDAVSTSADANGVVRDASDGGTNVWGHIQEYISMARIVDPEAYQDHPLFYVKKMNINGVKVGIASLSTAWRTKGGGAGDYGNLFVGEEQLNSVTSLVADCRVKIAVMHHSLEWLAPAEKAIILRGLSLNFSILLSGHNHDNNAQQIASNVGGIFVSNTGCLYEAEDYYNGYSILKIDHAAGEVQVTAREYYQQRREFDDAPRFSSGGKGSFSIQSSGSSRAISIPAEVLKATQETANSLLLSYASSDVAPKSLGAIFVEPPLHSVSEEVATSETAETVAATGRTVSLKEIAAASEDVLILLLGKRESGKTLLLHQIAVNRFLEFKKDARLGLVIDLGALRAFTSAAMLENAVQYTQGEMPRRQLTALLESGAAVLCIDNFNPDNVQMVSLLTDFIRRYKLVRYVVASAESFVRDVAAERMPELGVPIERYYIHPFEQRQTRELARRWFGGTDNTLKVHIEVLDRLFTSLRMPRTPFLVSVLLWVLEQRPDAHLVNQSAAIEVLVEGLLEKLKESNLREDFDSNIQQHFLSEFSAALDDRDAEWVPALEFDEFVLAYFKKRGLATSTQGFAGNLIRKGVLYEGGGRTGFKFDCFRAFFLARKFSTHPERWKNALQLENAHRYSTELDFFTGLARDRGDVLAAVVDLAEQFRTAYFDGIDLPLNHVDSLKDSQTSVDGRLLDAIEAAIHDPKSLIEAGNEPAKMVAAPGVARKINEEEARRRRIVPNASEVAKFVEQLRTCSFIVRNSELVEDIPLKRRAFDVVLRLWAQLVLVALVTVVEQKKEDFEMHNPDGKVFSISPEVVYLIRAIIPQALISFMVESLATPKLKLFMDESVKSEETMLRLMAVYLGLATGDVDGVENVKKLLRDLGKNKFVAEMTFFRLVQIYFLGSKGRKNDAFRDVLGDLFVKMRGWGSAEQSFGKSQFLMTLDKRAGASD